MNNEIDIWQTSPEEFNEWRRQNDILKLITFFSEALPDFAEWQKTYSVTDDLILKSNQTSEFFVGEGLRVFYRYHNPWFQGTTIKAEPRDSFDRAKNWADQNNKDMKEDREKFEYEVFTEFVPYFYWLNSIKKIKKFSVESSYKTSANFEDFQYNHWTGPPNNSYKAEIFGKYEALNIGGIRVSGHMLRGRNLDFANLDGLQITGKRLGGTGYTYIRYSSCRGMALLDLDMPFLEFERCNLSEINIIKCEMQDLHFIKCSGGFKKIQDSRLTHLIFNDCCPINGATDLNRADVPDYKFTNHSKIRAEAKYHFYNKMRKAAQDFGYTHQAQEDFYLERLYGMFVKFDPNIIREYRSLNNPKLRDLFKTIFRHKFRIDRTAKRFLRKFIQEIGTFLNFKFLKSYLAIRIGGIFEMINFLVWGFGERPKRVIVFAALDILLFATLYNHLFFNGNFPEAFITSVFVFTSIGYGEMNTSLLLQYLVGFQALSGLIVVGLFLSALVNKVRY